MSTVLQILSSSGRAARQDGVSEYQGTVYLTATDSGGRSENRYYVSVTGEAAKVDWQEGDRIMVELGLLAYNHGGQWHTSHSSDEMEILEIGKTNKQKLDEKYN